MAVLLLPEQHWVCPNCIKTHVTHESEPHTSFHRCPGVKGLSAPFVPDGVRCKVFAVDREDYVGKDLVQVDEDGRPRMAIITVRDDGQDCAVLAPTATASF